MDIFLNILRVCTIVGLVAVINSKVLAMDSDAHPTDMNTNSILVFDRLESEAKIAKKYRVIKDLRVSGSGQFSADELYKLLVAIPAPKNHIWIIDLRQESHGFIDGIPISWYKNQNTGNINKTASQIKKEEEKLLTDLSKQKSVAVYTLRKLDDGNVMVDKPTTMIPELVESEEQLVTSLGAHYKRLYVLDHNKPDDQEVDNFIDFIRKVKAQDWLHFHCRGGKGRSSTFIAMYDIILNSQKSTFVQIMQRQAKLGNIKLNELPTSKNKLWKSAAAKERYEFLKRFYIYVIDPAGYATHSWAAWNAAKTAN